MEDKKYRVTILPLFEDVVIDDIMEVRRLLYNRKKYKDDL